MSEMITIEQNDYVKIEMDNSEKDIVKLWQKGNIEVDLLMIERDSITPLILALLKLNPSSIPEVLKGIEEIKK